MEDIYGSFMRLKKNAFQGYWGKRILAELGYLLEMFSEKKVAESALLEQAVVMLERDYEENKQICVSTAKEAERLLHPLSVRAKSITMVCTAHAHIDMNWTWGYQETVAITLDTVRTMLTLMEEYPAFTFSQSQAAVYRILEEYEPELLEQVKQRVKEGRWEVTASTWVENDKNLSGGESMVRQLLYTKRYLSKLLDIREETMNLDFEPDTFGHSANYPEILNKGGVTRYFHCRGYEGENIYRWHGRSQSEVLVYREPGTKWYNGRIDCDVYKNIAAFSRKYGISKVLYLYGVGDHGGGPTRRDIERLIDMNTWPLFPKISFGTYHEYYDYLEERKEQFPVVDKELNYVFTGCYTSQSRIKMANRIGEARLIETETLESMAKLEIPEYKSTDGMEEAWRRILFNQFHDILPGSGIVETREYALGEFQKSMARAGANSVHAMNAICGHIADGGMERIPEDTAMGAGVGKGTNQSSGYGFPQLERGSGTVRYLALFNVTQAERTGPTEIILWDWREMPENTVITDMDGREYPFQVLERGKGPVAYWGHEYCRLLVWMPVPAVGYTICRVAVKTAESISYGWEEDDPREDDITDEPICLENEKIKTVFDIRTMKCISFLRKSDGKEFITPAQPACGLVLITEESSDGMSAWRVGRTSHIQDVNETGCIWIKKIQTQGLHKELEYEITGEKLKVCVTLGLDEGREYLDYRVKVIWSLLGSKETGIPQLRFQVPCSYEVEKYRYEVPYGMIDRQPLAQDVPAIGIGCALPKKGGSALYLMSDCKYGFRGDSEGLSLNLIRSSFEPDPFPESGEHIIRMAVGACSTDEENLVRLSEQYIHPVIVRSCGTRPQKEKASKSFLNLEGVVLSAIKETEDKNGYIIRVFNPSGEERIMRLYLPGFEIEAYLTDLLEHDIKQIDTEDKKVIMYKLEKYEVLSFRVIVK